MPVRTTQIVMESEDLQISVHKITVRYIFRNTSPKDIDALVEFPLPDLEGGDFQGPIDIPDEKRLNFVDFKVTCNGKPVATRMEARAFFKNRDVTALLHAAGLPVSVQYEIFSSAIKNVADAKFKELERDGLIELTNSNGYQANWTERVKFYWRQRFPAHSDVVLVQSYRPVVGGSYIGGTDNGSYIVKPYCGGPDVIRRIAHVKHLLHPTDSENYVNMFENDIDFILTTGNNWSGPIRHFRLLVNGDSRLDIVLTCMPGLKRIGPTRYELTRTNFHPSSDLKLLILQPNRQTKASK